MQLDFPKKKAQPQRQVANRRDRDPGQRNENEEVSEDCLCRRLATRKKVPRKRGKGEEENSRTRKERSEIVKGNVMREKEDGWLSCDFTNEILSQIYRVGS